MTDPVDEELVLDVAALVPQAFPDPAQAQLLADVDALLKSIGKPLYVYRLARARFLSLSLRGKFETLDMQGLRMMRGARTSLLKSAHELATAARKFERKDQP